MTLDLYHYLGLGAALFSIGVIGVVTRRNAIGVLIGVELILNAANVNLVGFSRYAGGLDGQVFALFVIVLAAAEAAVALAIILQLFDKRSDVDVDRASTLRG
ncbi:MAG: NADH-quinone oxidoreductase subunit NuoK [Planctomycetota bacterium]|jgi:NADH-quinone oxidoreductase subunit K